MHNVLKFAEHKVWPFVDRDIVPQVSKGVTEGIIASL